MRVVPTLLLGAVIVLGSGLFPGPVGAETPEELQTRIAEHSAEIERLNKEIAEYEKELQTVSSKKQTLQSTLNELDLQRKKLNASINVTKNRISTIQLEINRLAKGIAGKEESIETNEKGLGESLRRLNEIEEQPFVLSLLSSADISSVWTDADAARNLESAVNDRIRVLSEEKHSLGETKATSEKKRAELLAQQKTLVAEQGSLDATRKAQNELLAETKSQESSYQALLEQKQAEKESFEAAVFELASRLEYTLDPSKVPPAGRGILRWPLDAVVNRLCDGGVGKLVNCITQYFGKTSSSGRLYASGTHDGVDFRASVGAPVRASLSGIVEEVNHGAVRNCQYGMWVVVRHGNGLATLYAHLSLISVDKGQSVATGQLLGYAGNTGYATGPHLHFTVYLSDAVSFKNYRCKNGRSTLIPVAPVNAYMDPMKYL